MDNAQEKPTYQQLPPKHAMDKPTDMADHPLAKSTPVTSGKVVRYIRTIGSSSMFFAIFNQGASFAEEACKRYGAPDCAKYLRYFCHLVNLTALLVITTRWIWGKISQRKQQGLMQT
ncbi:uncharacterized protein DSM5745_08577 [Aspergillus mulundensis]|uniref:Uncharacterized protein n=1 Tax=Aspergillus mulundensis TaxID=1810919 RepID=A0A3D8R4A0_9EURO|nr:hypothetical protein DSM5745_08577 [Aspergillus mulundensis]RDW68817.1 hypothetical protein DSM5745_08577 [Aspergillus mulundensis]